MRDPQSTLSISFLSTFAPLVAVPAKMTSRNVRHATSKNYFHTIAPSNLRTSITPESLIPLTTLLPKNHVFVKNIPFFNRFGVTVAHHHIDLPTVPVA